MRSLAETGYNRRREECEEAARLLRVASLREVHSENALAYLPQTLRRRACHVVTENARVKDAIAGIDAKMFGEHMNASQQSLARDYEVSTPELDCLTALLQQAPDVFGAKLSGAGFGGACVALCRKGSARQVAQDVIADYKRAGGIGRILVPAGLVPAGP